MNFKIVIFKFNIIIGDKIFFYNSRWDHFEKGIPSLVKSLQSLVSFYIKNLIFFFAVNFTFWAL